MVQFVAASSRASRVSRFRFIHFRQGNFRRKRTQKTAESVFDSVRSVCVCEKGETWKFRPLEWRTIWQGGVLCLTLLSVRHRV